MILLQFETKHLCTINIKRHSGSPCSRSVFSATVTDELLVGWRHPLAVAKALHMLVVYEHA